MSSFDETITDNIATSLAEIPHPSLPKGSNIYGGTKIFPDYQAEDGETYFTLVHGIAHEVLRHRVLLSYEAEAEGVRPDQVIDRLLDLVPLP